MKARKVVGFMNRHRLTNEEMARRVGCAVSTVWRWRNNQDTEITGPAARVLEKLMAGPFPPVAVKINLDTPGDGESYYTASSSGYQIDVKSLEDLRRTEGIIEALGGKRREEKRQA